MVNPEASELKCGPEDTLPGGASETTVSASELVVPGTETVVIDSLPTLNVTDETQEVEPQKPKYPSYGVRERWRPTIK